ncbi:MFS transporter [Pseudonocardia kunmingensis]|uniref:Putative MFS family arabinose efflux permease n=1 Tax=Pseudonocardia kunmingensis TaxID=630975 RepID=A0A543E3Y0_9PSEU|nr:MFS transporter [Pseudonocardia kunmingensis]TQM16296.1 putative MFS family arabinose efflux permease [Pseudonocardia kunmingensis]
MGERCLQRPDAISAGPGARAASGLPVLLLATFFVFTNYAALLSVVPMWASRGGAADLAVGGTTGVMMAATVATQLTMRRLFRLMSLRAMVIAGSVLMGVPALFYPLSADVAPILLLTAVRGVGFGLAVTAGATLVTEVAPPRRLSASASYFGAAAALPNLGALAGGVWIAETIGFSVVFLSAGLAALAGAVVSWRLPGRARGRFQPASTADARGIAAPVVVFLMTAGVFGAVTAFLPLSGPDAGLAATALLAASAALVAARLAAGLVGDHHGAGRMLLGAAFTTALGCVLMAVALHGPAWLLLVGAVLLGAGFGACQNDSFVATVQRLGPTRSGTASTIWNIAYDGGLGMGAFALGGVLGRLGYAGAFLASAAALTAVAVAVLVGGAARARGALAE